MQLKIPSPKISEKEFSIALASQPSRTRSVRITQWSMSYRDGKSLHLLRAQPLGELKQRLVTIRTDQLALFRDVEDRLHDFEDGVVIEFILVGLPAVNHICDAACRCKTGCKISSKCDIFYDEEKGIKEWKANQEAGVKTGTLLSILLFLERDQQNAVDTSLGPK